MFDTDQPASACAPASVPASAAAAAAAAAPAADDPPPVPLERVEAQICALAGHLAAATCRFLVLLADFDARRGWASWEMNSCAAWLSWKCQMSSGTAREHVRVARALRALPVIRAGFAAGRLSYAKVRALTRIATAETEAGLAELAGPMTGNQLERFARAHRQVSQAGDAAARVRRRLTWRWEEDGSLSGSFRLPPLQGAVLLKALRAAAADLAPAGDGPPGVSAETPPAGAGPGPRPPGDPADPARCHVEDGPAISPGTAQMLTCTAALSWMRHGAGGAILALGRRRRRPSRAQRRAARDRDQGRCRFPGCGSRRTDLHHIVYWARGGRTDLGNLISLCRRHHSAVHDRGYLIAAGEGGGFTFCRPDGTALPASPPLPAPDGPLDDTHDAAITPETIIPPWYGERLDLDHAIWVCFANARTQRERRERAGQPAARRRATVYESDDWPERIRRYYAATDGQPRRPIQIPIQV
jgi:5-methylcytosine-specific restriction endonuclease McrA